MRYVQLRAFHNVCLTGGFSRAAEALYLTQPAVSDQIRKLEEEYDILLFHRRGKNVVPTKAGEELLEISRRFFEAEIQAQEFLQSRQNIASGTLRIIADSPIHLIHALKIFRTRYPDVNIKIQTGNSEDVLKRLRDYEADLGVLGADINESEYVGLPLNQSKLIAFVSKSHALANQNSIGFTSLLKHTLILRETGSRTRAFVDRLATKNNSEITDYIEAEGREAVKELVSIGAGVGVVSQAELSRDPELSTLSIKDCDIMMQETLVCLRARNQTKIIAAFFDAASESISE